jgi:hypothetical protein
MALVRKYQPTQQDVHVDQMLTNISVAYIQSQSVYISSQVFPVIPVGKQSDKYWTFPKNDWFRDEAKKRADSTESAGGGFTLSSDNYFCDVWAFHKDIGSQTKANADAGVQLERSTVEFVTQRLLLRQERLWVDKYFKTGVWGTDNGAVPKWSDYLNSDPMIDVENAKEAILSTTGFMPNTLVIGYSVFKALKNHPDIIDRIKYTTAENVTPALLARMFEVERLFISQAIYATNIEGETAGYAFTHGKNALLCHVAPSPSILTPSAGYTFAWTGVGGTLGSVVGVDAFDIRKTKSTRYEAEMAFDNKVVAADLGYFFNGVVA